MGGSGRRPRSASAFDRSSDARKVDSFFKKPAKKKGGAAPADPVTPTT